MLDVMNSKIRAKWTDDICRRNYAKKCRDFYANEHYEYVKDIIRARINTKMIDDSPSEADLMQNYYDFIPLTEAFTKDLARAFRAGVNIGFSNSDKDYTLLNKVFQNNIVNDIELEAYLKEIDRQVVLLGDCFVVPTYINKELSVDIITPDNCFVIENDDDPTKMDWFFYNVGVCENSPFKMGSANTYNGFNHLGEKWEIVISDSGNIKSFVQIDGQFTDYMPVAVFRSKLPTDKFFTMDINSTVENNLNFDLNLTSINMARDFDIPTRVNIGVPDDFEYKIGYSASINLPANPMGEAVGDVKMVSPNFPIDRHWNYLKERINYHSNFVGLGADNMSDASYSSGFQMSLAKQDLNDIIEDRQRLYRKPLKTLARCLLDLYNVINKSKLVYDLADVDIKFKKSTVLVGETEKQQGRALELSNGTADSAEFIMRDNPNLTREEAEKVAILYKPKASFSFDIGADNGTK